jgi:hypothetical protein
MRNAAKRIGLPDRERPKPVLLHFEQGDKVLADEVELPAGLIG